MHTNRPSHVEILMQVKAHGSVSSYARALGLPRRTVNDWVIKANEVCNMASQDDKGDYPKTTYVITSAQIDTSVHKGFLENLEALAKDRNAVIIIPGITYNKSGGISHGGTGNAENKFNDNLFDYSIRKYLHNHRTKLNDKIELLGNLNILPTAVNPLSGYQTFTGTSSAILPHPKIALESVATAANKLTKFLVTTGSVTVPNYMQKNAGIKGEFHHQLGAVLVEVVSNKQFHMRHILAEEDGSFYDLTERYEGGKKSTGHSVDAIVWGDIHSEDIDPVVRKISWEDPDCLIDVLRPRYQFFHDLLDFKYRNHHNRDDDLFMKLMNNKSVKGEIANCVSFLASSFRLFCTSVVVASNHDNAYTRWVKENTHHNEPDLDNAIFLLESQLHLYVNAKKGVEPNLFQWASLNQDPKVHMVTFLNVDESFKVNKIECGMHGDKGLNGSRGSLKSFAKIGVKCNVGHSHSAAIYEGVYMAGCSRTLNASYASGPSSWSHSHIIQYKNGKRAILTAINGQYYAHKQEI